MPTKEELADIQAEIKEGQERLKIAKEDLALAVQAGVDVEAQKEELRITQSRLERMRNVYFR